MMKSGAENVKVCYEQGLKGLTDYMMENPGKDLSIELRLPENYKENLEFRNQVDIMNEIIGRMGMYNKFSVKKREPGVFLARISYDMDQTVAYAQIEALNNTLSELAITLNKIDYKTASTSSQALPYLSTRTPVLALSLSPAQA